MAVISSGFPSKCADVFLGPCLFCVQLPRSHHGWYILYSREPVGRPNTGVGSSALMQERRSICQSSHTKTVVIGDKDEVRAKIEESFWCVLRLAATSETTTVCPLQDRKALTGTVCWCPNIHKQAIFGRRAIDIGVS